MPRRPRLPLRLSSAALLLISLTASAHARNVIIMIGDGMGPEQVKAGGIYENGEAGTLAFEGLANVAMVRTRAANDPITDSAASGTAIATGRKVNNRVISMAIPGDGRELETLLEVCKARGMATGLVTTTAMTHATPAAFGAHEPTRKNAFRIANDYLTQTKPNVLFGGGGAGMSVTSTRRAGYRVVTDRAGLKGVRASQVEMLAGLFGVGHMPYELDGLAGLPHLSEMTAVAFDALARDPDGYFLMIEGGRIDHACHDNDIERAVREVVAFDAAFSVMWSRMAACDETLLIVTADHETGGMTVTRNNGKGVAPTVTWSTDGHSAANVGVYAWGPGAQAFRGTIDNTDIHRIVMASLNEAAPERTSALPGR
jgi:alkaline phosphatase